MAETSSALTRYYVEFGDEQHVVVGRTESVDAGFTGLVTMPESLHGTVVWFYRIVNEATGMAGDWGRVTPGPSIGASVTMSVDT